MRVAIYARLSRDNSGISENVDIQILECREHAQEHGWTVVGVFSDSDISASKYSTKLRPGYHTMITALKNDGFEAVLVTEMTRLYRRLDELQELMRLAERSSLIYIIAIDETSYDLSTGQGIHNAVSAVNNAMMESRKISDRVRRKFRARAKSGLPHGGSRPLRVRDGRYGHTGRRGPSHSAGSRSRHPGRLHYCHRKRPQRARRPFSQRARSGATSR